jgi:hypothetical protein
MAVVLGLRKQVELIMAFSHIVGVSCDGHIEKLRMTFAHILAGKEKKVAKKIVGGGQVGRKGTRDSLTLSLRSIMREKVEV